jgi:hypothetical protein
MVIPAGKRETTAFKGESSSGQMRRFKILFQLDLFVLSTSALISLRRRG